MIVVEQPAVFPSSRTPTSSAGVEQGGQAEGTTSSHSSPEEKFSDNISSASEASETTSGSQYSHKKKPLQSGLWLQVLLKKSFTDMAPFLSRSPPFQLDCHGYLLLPTS